MSQIKPYIVEIADFIFFNPEKKMSEEIAVFCSKFQKTERTIWNYVSKAQEYNKKRQGKIEKAKNEELIEKAKESLKSNILKRNEALEILSNIAKGNARPEGELLPSDAERIRAIQQLSKMEGWDSALKIEGKINLQQITGMEIINSHEDKI